MSNVAPPRLNPQVSQRWFPHWRKMTWTLIIFTGIMIAWMIGGASSATDSHAISQCVANAGGALSAQDCQSASQAGAGIGVALLIGLWFMGFVVLSLVWFMTRPKHRTP
jgi:hypothetical protein